MIRRVSVKSLFYFMCHCCWARRRSPVVGGFFDKSVNAQQLLPYSMMEMVFT